MLITTPLNGNYFWIDGITSQRKFVEEDFKGRKREKLHTVNSIATFLGGREG